MRFWEGRPIAMVKEKSDASETRVSATAAELLEAVFCGGASNENLD